MSSTRKYSWSRRLASNILFCKNQKKNVCSRKLGQSGYVKCQPILWQYTGKLFLLFVFQKENINLVMKEVWNDFILYKV